MGKYKSGSTPISESLAPRISGKKPHHSKREGQFRSNLYSLLSLFKEIKNFINEEHHKILMKTPFYHFFCTFLSNKVEMDKIRKSDVALRNLIKRYQPSKKSFLLGQTNVPLRVSDIALIFGIVSGDVDVKLANEKKPDEAFVERRGLKGGHRTNGFLRLQIIDSVKGNTPTDVEDFVKLLCLYALNTVFFSATNSKLSPCLILLVEDLDKMKSYAWAALVHEHLILSIEENHKTPGKCHGCVIALQYWLCEHTNLTQPSGVHHFPRFLKWNLPSIHPVLNKIGYDSISEEQVRVSELDAASTEIVDMNIKYTSEVNEMLTVNITPSVKQISRTSTMPSVEPINDTSTMPSTEQINDTSVLVYENEILKQQPKADKERIEELTCKHQADMKRIEDLTCKHKELVAQVQQLNALVASITQYHPN